MKNLVDANLNKKIGKVTILEKVPDYGINNLNYFCICECGNQFIRQYTTLYRSLTKKVSMSCGCMKGKWNQNKIKSKSALKHRVGERFGRLTIVDNFKAPDKRGWECITLCDCGNKSTNRYWDLKHEKVISCGCYGKEQQSITGSRVGLNNGTINCSKYNWFFVQNNKKVKMRSGYEVMYAKHLTQNNIEWQYEPKLFKLKDGMRYTPDFYLPESNEWIDVKGQITEKHKLKHNLFKKAGHNLRLVFIEEIEFLSGERYVKFKNNWTI